MPDGSLLHLGQILVGDFVRTIGERVGCQGLNASVAHHASSRLLGCVHQVATGTYCTAWRGHWANLMRRIFSHSSMAEKKFVRIFCKSLDDREVYLL